MTKYDGFSRFPVRLRAAQGSTHSAVIVVSLAVYVIIGLAPIVTGHFPTSGYSDYDNISAGVYHGIFIPMNAINTGYNDTATVYQAHNDGQVYTYGFGVGILIFLAYFYYMWKQPKIDF